MVDDLPLRKQQHLLVKGREKVSELLRRRKRRKHDEACANTDPQSKHTELKDEVPILSRISDPAATAKPSLNIKLKVRVPSHIDTVTLSETRTPSLNQTLGQPLQEAANREESTHEKVTRAPKREGVVGMDDLKSRSQPAFSTEVLMAQHKPIAKQPSSTQQTASFDFSSRSPSSSKYASIAPSQFFGPLPAQTRFDRPQLQQAARDAFLESKPEPKHLPDEEFSSEKQGMSVRAQALRSKYQAVHPNKDQNVTAKRLFDDFKLGPNRSIELSHDESPKSVVNPSIYIRPKITIPDSAPEIYRALHHKPTLHKTPLPDSMPNNIESSEFVDDIELGLTPTVKNNNGDVPALSLDSRIERVPLGARYSASTTVALTAIYPGRHVTQPAVNATTPTMRPRRERVNVPENFFTAPNRLSAAYFPRSNLKRKRPADASLSPPSYIHQRTSCPNFNVFANGILLYPELCLLLAAQLPVQTLINLYSISKDFHIILNQRFTTAVLNQATKKAPAAARCYPWRCYAHLCQPDPAYTAGVNPRNANFRDSTGGTNITTKLPPLPIHGSTSLPGASGVVHSVKSRNIHIPPSKRRIPTFRWLHMAIHREKTIHEIYWLFAARGVPLPGDPSITHPNSFALSLHKMWFGMDIPDNARRMAYFNSHVLITPTDLSHMLVFVVKLDMICNDPLAGEKRDALRKIFMSSPNGFDTLRAALKGEIWRDELEMLRAWTRYAPFTLEPTTGQDRPNTGGGFVPLGLSAAEQAMSSSVFGIPRLEVGLHKKEFWGTLQYDFTSKTRKENPPGPTNGRKLTHLMRVDQIVLREGVRRGMKMGKQFLRALLHGYVDPETLEAVPPRDLNGGRSRILEREGEYAVDGLVGGVRALSVEDGGDPLLDVGNDWEGSPLTVERVGAREQIIEMQQKEKALLEVCKAAWREDVKNEEEERKARRGFTFVDG